MATVIFFTPHQDDETLAMGPSVRRHLEAGHDVHVVLMTNGVNSAVRPSTGLSPTDFIAARDDEMFRASRQLGVRTANTHVSALRVDDGTLTVDEAEAIMTEYFTAYPGAWCKSYSNLPATGRHVDHVTAGQAAVNLYKSGVVTNLRLYVEPWLQSAFHTANPTVGLIAERGANPPSAAVLRAFDEYKLVDTVGGKYGIGYKSVGAEFDAARPDPVSYYHVP